MINKYLIADCIIFEPNSNSIYRYPIAKGGDSVEYDIGDNSKDILLVLVERDGCISAEELLQEVWREKRKIEVDITSVRQAVSKLRKSLSVIAPDIEIIKTVPKAGYVLNAQVTLIKNELIVKSDENKIKVKNVYLQCVWLRFYVLSYLLFFN